MYNKVISYSDILEIYQYEEPPRPSTRKGKRAQAGNELPLPLDVGEDVSQQKEPPENRSPESIRRSISNFKRLVRANLGESEIPILASFTYAENMQSIEFARKDFNAFARALRGSFGSNVRYIAVAEQQRRGAIHFHSLLWGLPAGVVGTERTTRLVARLWGKGFVDLVQTDGSPKLSTYLAKYFTKQFQSPLFFGKKAYITSRNIIRPVVDKNAILSMYLSTDQPVRPLQDREYMTPYMGKVRYRLLDQVKLSYEPKDIARG